MPTMAGQTVKKYDGTTDITWTNTQTGGSKERPAIWTSNTVGSAGAHRPEFRYWVERKGDGAKYTVHMSAHYPSLSTDSTTGITSVIGKQKLKAQFEIDSNFVQTDINEAVAQAINLMDTADLIGAIRLGQSFT